MALTRLEGEQASGPCLERLATGFHPDAPVQDEHERVLLDLVVAKLLAGIEPDENRSRGVVGVQHHRRPAPTRRLDLVQIPPAHGRILPLREPSQAWRSPRNDTLSERSRHPPVRSSALGSQWGGGRARLDKGQPGGRARGCARTSEQRDRTAAARRAGRQGLSPRAVRLSAPVSAL